MRAVCQRMDRVRLWRADGVGEDYNYGSGEARNIT